MLHVRRTAAMSPLWTYDRTVFAMTPIQEAFAVFDALGTSDRMGAKRCCRYWRKLSGLFGTAVRAGMVHKFAAFLMAGALKQ